MAIKLKSQREIDLMRKAGSTVAAVLSKLQNVAAPGVSTLELDKLAEQMCKDVGAIPLFKGVRSFPRVQPFPGCICASVNEQVVHGIPSEKVVLRDGDILSVDFGVKLDGYCGDAAVTIPIGNVDRKTMELVDVTRRVLEIAVEETKPGRKWSDVARLMQEHAESAGFCVVTDFVGHGIGREMHEDPKVPNFVSKELLNNDIALVEGLVLAVEPMINIGTHAVRTLADGWTVVTRNGKCSAHFEHTIAVTKNGCEVLTAEN